MWIYCRVGRWQLIDPESQAAWRNIAAYRQGKVPRPEAGREHMAGLVELVRRVLHAGIAVRSDPTADPVRPSGQCGGCHGHDQPGRQNQTYQLLTHQ